MVSTSGRSRATPAPRPVPDLARRLRPSWLLLAAGTAAAVVAAAVDTPAARAAAAQDWAPFVLVAGLLLVGLVAAHDGLFAAAGGLLASATRSGVVLYLGSAVLVVVVTAVLNLDTSVAFLTPVLAAAAARRGGGSRTLLAGCLLLSNAGSLLLPGSNLTNLIVLGHLHLPGSRFVARTGGAWLAGVLITAAVVAVVGRHDLRRGERAPRPARPVLGIGAAAVLAAAVAVVTLRDPALAVAGVGVVAVAVRRWPPRVAGRDGQGRDQPPTTSGDLDQIHGPSHSRRPLVARPTAGPHRLATAAVVDALGLPTLVGLFGAAVALGVLGRSWSGPHRLLGHAGSWETAAVGALASMAVNNLPAASLLAARVVPHPVALLVGLDLGPNLLVTGSLAWLLWLRAARAAGARPSIPATIGLGWLATPAAMAAALGMLSVTAPH